ncbi:MAG: hypothetical protein WA133_04925 [Syntrophales bacterium]
MQIPWIIHASQAPIFPGIKELVEKGIMPGGLHRAGLTNAAIVGEAVSGAQHGIRVLCR